MKKKKILIGVIIILIIAVAVGAYLFITRNNEEETQKGSYEEVTVTIGTVELSAVDQEGEPIVGVVFDLMAGEKVYGSLETGVDGKIMFYGVPIGEYTLRGTTLPEGYEGAGAEETFEVIGGETTEVQVSFTRNVPRLVVTVENEQEEPIESAKIDLYDTEGSYMTTLITNDEGKAFTDLDEVGEYYIQQIETAEGYVIDDTLYRVTLDNEEGFTFYTTIVNSKTE